MISGYPGKEGGQGAVHGVNSIVFDVDTSTNDLVVAGQMRKDTSLVANTLTSYIFFVKAEEECGKVAWMMEMTALDS